MRTLASRRLLLLIALGAMLSSCGELSPAGFWTSYRPDAIVKKGTDQGPRGGSRWIHWTSEIPHTFDAADAVHFAEENGWTCDQPETYPAGRMSTWTNHGDPVFPLFSGGNVLQPPNDEFPRHILDDSIIVRCQTGWIRVAPGTDESSPAFGYIQVSSDGAQMAVYHLWGEA